LAVDATTQSYNKIFYPILFYLNLVTDELEGFVEGMLSKKDKNSGLKQICFINDLPFCSEDNLAHLLMSEYGPTEFKYLAPNLWYSEEVLNGLRNSPGLQSDTLFQNF